MPVLSSFRHSPSRRPGRSAGVTVPTGAFRPGILLAVGALLLVPAPGWSASPGDIVINEVMQNPAAVSDASGEWFEVTNTTAGPIDINGWVIAGNATESHTIAAGGPLVVAAGGFLVIGRVADPALNGGYTPDYVMSGVSLGNASDQLVLRAAGATIDSVAWDDGATFPDPDGASMELEDPSSDNNVGANWSANTSTPYGLGDTGTPGARNANATGGGTGTPPAIANVIHLPGSPLAGDTVRVRADVTDDVAVTEVSVEYRVNGGSLTVAAAGLVSGTTYQATIPPAPSGSLVEYMVVARDGDANTSRAPEGAPAVMYSYSVGGPAPLVSLNEVLADPPVSTGDPLVGDVNRDGIGDAFEDEFVELVNYGTTPVDISGWTLSDDDTPGAEFAFPPGTVIPPLGFVTLFGGGSPQGFSGSVFTDDGRIGNGLGNTGDTVLLRASGVVIDVLVYAGEGGNDEAMIRVPDGTGDWSRPSEEGFDDPYTPQAPNGGIFAPTERKSWGMLKAMFE